MNSRKTTDCAPHPDEPPLPRVGSVGNLSRTALGAFASNVRHYLREEYDLGTESVYVVGSWARGEAMIGVSDLDVRVVTNESPGVETGERIREELKSKMEWTPGSSTYPDVAVTPLQPDESEPKVKIQ